MALYIGFVPNGQQTIIWTNADIIYAVQLGLGNGLLPGGTWA